MKPIKDFKNTGIQYVFCDIDDTLTTHGKLPSDSYKALWDLDQAGIQVIPVTGRPAGWCEMIARLWPVSGVIGENGGFYFCYKNKKMHRHYAQSDKERELNQFKIEKIKNDILKQVPEAGIASDQFCRQLDLAVDFCEDVTPLSSEKIDEIVSIFKSHGAQVKVSSIHVNGWFGDHNKLSMCHTFCEQELGFFLKDNNSICAFIGDSPNDEPMFEFFTHSFAVANIKNFINGLTSRPQYITPSSGGTGFVEFTKVLID